MPRDRRLWLFGEGFHRFADNSMYLFQYVVENHPEVEAVWITKNVHLARTLQSRGYKAYHHRSLRAMWLGLRAKFYLYTFFVNDIGFWTSRNATRVNLWHGSPIKKIEHDIVDGPTKLSNTFWDQTKQPHRYIRDQYMLSTSDFVCKTVLQSAFRLLPGRCLDLGYPRCDILLKDRQEVLGQLISNHDSEYAESLRRLLVHKKIILYLPTFREGAWDQICPGVDIPSINAICHEHDAVFVVRPHPWIRSKEQYPDADRVVIMPTDKDLYPLMALSDIVVTDYSSVIFDFMLTGRPVVIYAYDLEEYKRKCRDLYVPLESLTIRDVASDNDELCNILKDLIAKPERNYESEVVDRFHRFKDGRSCERIAQHLLNMS
jgi:CDP-glycerol glycerophosphotransferase (TagB/SpsB family)